MGCTPEVGILEHSVCPATPRDNYGLPPEGMLSEWNARAVSQHPRPDEVASLVSELGKGALLAKVDIHAAYRLIPVHPQDRLLLAMRWEGQIYIDPMLPFGLRSAPKVFNAVADALNWHLHQMGIPLVCHYLDDFIIIAPSHSTQCQQSLAILDKVCESLGVSLAEHKRDSPTTCRPSVFLFFWKNSK